MITSRLRAIPLFSFVLLFPGLRDNKLLEQLLTRFFFCVGVMYSGEYDACDVTLSVYPHRASLKNMPDHGGNRTRFCSEISHTRITYRALG